MVSHFLLNVAFFLGKLVTLAILSETGGFRDVLGSSPRRLFLAPKITCFGGLAREAQKRETGSIRSEGDLRWVDLEVLGWILGFP